MTALIYIGGYGRSGSTLLEALLTTYPDVLACGEIVGCLRSPRDRGCTCGLSREQCRIWGPIYDQPQGPRHMNHTELTCALLERANGRYDYMIDSSKTAWGLFGAPFRLRGVLEDRFHLIHIVRDPRGVCWSNVRRTRRQRAVRLPLLHHLKTSIGWWAANLSCELFRLRYPERYTRVRYDDLARSYETVLSSLRASLGIEPAPRTKSAASDNRHQLFGNHNRLKGFSPAEIREDVRWKTTMPSLQKIVVAAATWPLRRRYGY